MPELPEVETTRRGIEPHVLGRRVERVVVRERRLRWPVPAGLPRILRGQVIEQVERRAKYLLLRCTAGTAILHLGMSGSLRLVSPESPPGPHDHVDLVFADGGCLRLRDPRRFGALLWTRADPTRHRLLAGLGPEPLDARAFDAAYLARRARGRRVPIRDFLLDGRVVVGVGNIYANEAAFRAGIHPARAAGRIGPARLAALVDAIRAVLMEAIAQGGTTLRDFVGGDGQPGYFRTALAVYDRAGEPCLRCSGGTVRRRTLGQRSIYYCGSCQH